MPWLLIFLTCVLAFQPYFKARKALKESKRKLLETKLKGARDRRTHWKRDHPWAGINHPEYQKLWEIEIGAEDLYLLFTREDLPNMSWSEYNLEQARGRA